VVGDEAGDPLRQLGRVPGGDGRETGDVVVFPCRGVPEQLGEPGDPLDAGDRAQWLARLLGRCLGERLSPGHAVIAGHVGVGDDPGVVLTEPFAEPAHGDFQFLHRRGSIGQPAGGQPFAGHGLHPRRQDQRRLPGRHQLAWLGGDLAPVEQHYLQLVQMGDPLLGGMLEEALLRGVEQVQVAAFAEQPDGLQCLGDVVVGDLAGMLDAGVEGDPADRPPHRLAKRSPVVAEGDCFLDQLGGAQADAQRRGGVIDADLLGAEHPRVVEGGIAAQAEEQQVGAGVEGDGERRGLVRLLR
jgi:hypothetical protein